MDPLDKIIHRQDGEIILRRVARPSWTQRALHKFSNTATAVHFWYLAIISRMPFNNPFKHLIGLFLGRKRDFDKTQDCSFYHSILGRKHSQMKCEGDGHKACNLCRHFNINTYDHKRLY
jgi:hypothetical protein